MTGSVYRPAPTAQLAKLATSTTLGVFADRIALLFILSLIVLSGPAGEGVGTGSAELFWPIILFGFACGALTDVLGGRGTMMIAAGLGAVIMFAAPGLMVLTSANRLAVGAVVALCSLAGTFFSIGRLVLTKTVTAPKDLIKVNAALLVCSSIATLYSVSLFSLIETQVIPAQGLKVCSALAILAALVAALVRTPGKVVTRIRGESSTKAMFKYLAHHAAARDILRLSVILYFPFAFWSTVMFCLIAEGFQPGGTDLHSMLQFAFAGCAIGALLAPRADRIARPLTVLCAAAAGIFLSSLICTAASQLTTIKYAIGIAGVNGGIAIVVLDRLLQTTFPRRILGSAVGCRNALVAGLMLVSMLAMEQQFERISLVIIFRLIGIIHLLFGLILFFAWPRFRQYLFKVAVWPVLSNARKIKFDSPHHLRSTRATVFAMQQLGWKDAATICGAFITPANFLLISSRTRPLDRFMLEAMGGIVARDEDDSIRKIRHSLHRGYNVLLFSDDLAEQKSKLVKKIVALCSERPGPSLIPCAVLPIVNDPQAVLFKCGIPFTRDRRISEKKLTDELSTLRATTPSGGEQHVG